MGIAGNYGQLAVLCENVTWGADDNIEESLEALGGGALTIHRLSGGLPTLAVAVQPAQTIVAIGGTNSALIWFLNIAGTQQQVALAGVPGGVAQYFALIAQAFKSFIGVDRPIVLTGHSLGGAVAQILAVFYSVLGGVAVECLAFGSPRAGDATFATSVDPSPIVHVVQRGDPIPLVPFGIGTFGVWTHAEVLRQIYPNACPGKPSSPLLWTPVLSRHFIAGYINLLAQCGDPLINAKPVIKKPKKLHEDVEEIEKVFDC